MAAVAAALVLAASATAQVTAVNGRIAYSVCEYNSTIGFTTCDIWTINPDGSGETNLTNTPDVNEFDPVWSADGTKIAFVEGFTGVNRLFAMNDDGTSVVPILDTPSFQFGPSWSPDGTQIAFATDRYSSNLETLSMGSYRIGLVDVQTGTIKQLNAFTDGKNINHGCGAVHPEGMARAIQKHGADLGLALDGDADRVILADEQGRVVDGDAIMALVGRDLIRQGALAKRTVVATVMSNGGLERALAPVKGRVVRTAVGDRYVVEEMRRSGYNFGGEQSGHLIFLDHVTTGDGVAAGLNVLAVMQREGRPLSELARCFEPVPQALVNVVVREKRPLSELPGVARAVAAVEKALGADGRVLVRFSGTENKARVLVEGTDAKRIRAFAESIADELRKAIG
jgi:dipeptidyl aminopeptidase/acylaminoacyl peptidase